MNKIHLGREFGLSVPIDQCSWRSGVEVHVEVLQEELAVERTDTGEFLVQTHEFGYDNELLGTGPIVRVPILYREESGEMQEYCSLFDLYDQFERSQIFVVRTEIGSAARRALGRLLTRARFLAEDLLELGNLISIPRMNGNGRVDSHGNSSFMTLFRIFEKARRAKLFKKNKVPKGAFSYFRPEYGRNEDGSLVYAHLGNLARPNPDHTYLTYRKLERFATFFGLSDAFQLVDHDGYECKS